MSLRFRFQSGLESVETWTWPHFVLVHVTHVLLLFVLLKKDEKGLCAPPRGKKTLESVKHAAHIQKCCKLKLERLGFLAILCQDHRSRW